MHAEGITRLAFHAKLRAIANLLPHRNRGAAVREVHVPGIFARWMLHHHHVRLLPAWVGRGSLAGGAGGVFHKHHRTGLTGIHVSTGSQALDIEIHLVLVVVAVALGYVAALAKRPGQAVPRVIGREQVRARLGHAFRLAQIGFISLIQHIRREGIQQPVVGFGVFTWEDHLPAQPRAFFRQQQEEIRFALHRRARRQSIGQAARFLQVGEKEVQPALLVERIDCCLEGFRRAVRLCLREGTTA